MTGALASILAAAPTGEAAKSGPWGLAIILVLCAACYFLFKSMSRHLRKVREDFPADPAKQAKPPAPSAPQATRPSLAEPDTSADEPDTSADEPDSADGADRAPVQGDQSPDASSTVPSQSPTDDADGSGKAQ